MTQAETTRPKRLRAETSHIMKTGRNDSGSETTQGRNDPPK